MLLRQRRVRSGAGRLNADRLSNTNAGMPR